MCPTPHHRGLARAVADRDFRFCFKLPRRVTHEQVPDVAELDRFVRAIAPLEAYLGPLLIQFPARVGPEHLDTVAAVLARLPAQWRCAIEVRHRRFFTRPALLEPLLRRFRLGRVVLDTRALYRGDRGHAEVRAALHEKPDLPVLPGVFNELAFVRLVLHPDRRDNQRYMVGWAANVARWLAEGKVVYVMIHCPNNLHCPELAVGFHATLRHAMPELAALPPWPVPRQQALL